MKRLVGLFMLLLALPVWANTVTVPLKAGSALPPPVSPGCQQNFVQGANGLMVDTYACPSGAQMQWTFSVPDTYAPQQPTAFGVGACTVLVTWWPGATDPGGGCWAATIIVFPDTITVLPPVGLFDGDNWLSTNTIEPIEGPKEEIPTPVEGHPYIYALNGVVPQNAFTGTLCSQTGQGCVGNSAAIVLHYDGSAPSCLSSGAPSFPYTQTAFIKRVKLFCPAQ